MTSKGMEKMNPSTIGVDISKDTLDAFRLRDGASRRFANDKAGHKALIKWIGKEEVRVVFEPTGAYHRSFEQALDRAGLPLVKVNPRQARPLSQLKGCGSHRSARQDGPSRRRSARPHGCGPRP
jgi:transposase